MRHLLINPSLGLVLWVTSSSFLFLVFTNSTRSVTQELGNCELTDCNLFKPIKESI